jgi:hypothetical protein
MVPGALGLKVAEAALCAGVPPLTAVRTYCFPTVVEGTV